MKISVRVLKRNRTNMINTEFFFKALALVVTEAEKSPNP